MKDVTTMNLDELLNEQNRLRTVKRMFKRNTPEFKLAEERYVSVRTRILQKNFVV